MATYPYISGPGNVAQMVNQLRKAFPSTISSDSVKKLGIAPNNESYVINAMQFLGIIDVEGKKTNDAAQVFSHHKIEDFAQHFASLVEKAYAPLFELHGSSAWELNNDELITFFRQSDQTSSIIGSRQAGLFRVCAGLAGHGEIPEPKAKKTNINIKNSKNTSSNKAINKTQPAEKNMGHNSIPKGQVNPMGNGESSNIGLTVRVEINLPADGTKETYDNIFKSIKENLLGG